MYHVIDLAALDEYLSSDDSPDNCMMLSDLDGFIHGILCCPIIIPSEEWMPIAFGADPEPLPRSIVQSVANLLKAGDRDVRATLYAAANALLMRTMAGSQIKTWGMRLLRTKGRRRAVVAVARKLAVLLHWVWIDGTEFRQDQVGGTA
jgi:hypothetical protein